MRLSRRTNTAIVIVVAVLVAAAFVALLWHGAAWLDASQLRGLKPVQRESAIDAIRGRLLQLGAGLVIGGGLVYTGLTFRLNRESQVTDRYTKAIEQLGNDSLDVKLGAIYALERIMIDSARDHATIVEVLAAYVREHAPQPDYEGYAPPTPTDPNPRPSTDVQAALTVLGRRPKRAERRNLDLERTNLAGADLPWAQLRGARLYRTNLAGAHLVLADLTDAQLTCANLVGADLTHAQLRGAHLFHTNLDHANLSYAKLNGADLPHAKLNGSNLDHADLSKANLIAAELADAKLDSAKLDDPPPEIVVHTLRRRVAMRLKARRRKY